MSEDKIRNVHMAVKELVREHNLRVLTPVEARSVLLSKRRLDIAGLDINVPVYDLAAASAKNYRRYIVDVLRKYATDDKIDGISVEDIAIEIDDRCHGPR